MQTKPVRVVEKETVVPERPTSERRVIYLLCVMACLTLAHAIYHGYSDYYLEVHSNHPGRLLAEYYRQHNSTAVSAEHPLFRGLDHAPNQYRVLVPFAARFLADQVHLTKYYLFFPMFDFFCALGCCWLLYRLLWRSSFCNDLPKSYGGFLGALLLFWIAYAFAWVVPWQRPETLPTALYLAGMLTLLNLVGRRPALLTAVVGATLLQGFVRAEVPIAFGIAVGMFSLTRRGPEMFGSRVRGIVTAILVCGSGLATQAVLRFVLFPGAAYAPDTDAIQVFHNLHARPMLTFLVAMLPCACILLAAARRQRSLDPEDVLAVTACFIYLPLWFVSGIVSEVRIFVPFLLLLAPTAAKVTLLLQQGARPARFDGTRPALRQSIYPQR